MSVSIDRDNEIAVVILDNPPVNAIGHAMRQGLVQAVDTLDADSTVKAVVLIAAGRTFIAGADISEFGQPPELPHLPDVIRRLESAKTPWVAAIHGSALGGGLEIALGCHFRIADQDARLGLPEVTLGLVPGAGGTVRLPRLVDPAAAIELATTGKPVSATQALGLGLIDAVFNTDNLRSEAIRFARDALSGPLPTPLSSRDPVNTPDADFWQSHKQQVEKRARGQKAPLRVLECVRTAVEDSVDKAFALERSTFLELRDSTQAKALRHVFFAERAATKPPELAGVEPRPIRSVGVIGGGTMGAGIAAALRDVQMPVVLIERDKDSLDRGQANLKKIWDSAVKRGRLTDADRNTRLSGVQFATDYAALASVDMVIEAVFEDLDIKRDVFLKLERACRADAVLATNTSYLDPDMIARDTQHPERVLGLHFFSPANVMKLLEIVPTSKTANDVIATGFSLARSLRKIPVRAGICDGFIGNRILKITRAQAEKLLLLGATPAAIDRAMRTFGLPMGPLEVQDLGGLDIAAFQRKAARERGEQPFAPIADRLVALNRLGQKSGGGWYDYVEGDRTPRPTEVVNNVIAEESEKAGLGRPELSDEAVAEHIVFPMINEGASILEESIAHRPADIDLVEIHGYGFPRWRGGLMHYGESVGLEVVVDTLQAMAAKNLCTAPCDLLVSAAAKGHFA